MHRTGQEGYGSQILDMRWWAPHDNGELHIQVKIVNIGLMDYGKLTSHMHKRENELWASWMMVKESIDGY